MDAWIQIVFGILLIAIGVILLGEHASTWRRLQDKGLHRDERSFLSRQYRRRTQTSLLITLIGILVIVGVWVESPQASVTYWGGVTLLVGFLFCSAMLDWSSSLGYYNSLRHQTVARRDALLKEFQSRQGADLPVPFENHENDGNHGKEEQSNGEAN